MVNDSISGKWFFKWGWDISFWLTWSILSYWLRTALHTNSDHNPFLSFHLLWLPL